MLQAYIAVLYSFLTPCSTPEVDEMIGRDTPLEFGLLAKVRRYRGPNETPGQTVIRNNPSLLKP